MEISVVRALARAFRSARQRAAPRRNARSLLSVILVGFLLCGFLPLAVAQPTRFDDVKAWRGTFIAKAHQYTSDAITARAQNLGSLVIYYDSSFTADFLLDDFEDDPAVWRGRIINPALDADYRGVKHQIIDIKEGNTLLEEESFNTSGTPSFGEQPVVELLFHRERGWSFHMSTPYLKTGLTEKFTLTPKKGPVIHQETEREISASAHSGTETRPYPARGMVLFAGAEKSDGKRHIPGALAGDIEWEYTVYLEPAELEELRLEIDEPAAYANWRPDTTPQRDAGTPLEITARLVSSTGGKPNTKVERFEWELQNTSKEPGVTLNFPLKATDAKFDLELDASGEYFVLSKENQKMERAVREGWSDTVKVVPFDWGGWSTLQVTAILADGRRVSGKLKGKSEYGVRVPKRDKDSRIADGWKTSTGASGADKDDDEKIEGQKDNGDGFTLYEEYRGWIHNGEHLGGDPKDKDFFVLNLIGADAEPGIGLFAAVSQLAVHFKLRPEEMSEETRLMNGNRREGPHNKDQHGVWVKTFASKSELGDDGAQTVMNEKGVAGRPGITKGIGILARDNTESAFNKPFNLPAEDAIFAFDRAIAHELLHSVGVEHHGTGDYTMIVGYASTRNPLNKLGRPYYGTSPDKPIDLRTEEGEDVAQRDLPDYKKFREFTDMMMLERYLKEGADYIKRNGVGYGGFTTPQDYADLHIEILLVFCFMHINGPVGVDHGEHSGEEDCLMRYYFAKYYESKKPPVAGEKMFYLVAPGAERIGMQLCRSGKGTGVNDAGHQPQSRYSDTAGDGGNCFEQICPNDAIPPRSVK